MEEQAKAFIDYLNSDLMQKQEAEHKEKIADLEHHIVILKGQYKEISESQARTKAALHEQTTKFKMLESMYEDLLEKIVDKI